jgi:hypothetical protein
MAEVATVQCSRCRVAVPADKLALANRCMDQRCPLAPAQQPQESKEAA